MYLGFFKNSFTTRKGSQVHNSGHHKLLLPYTTDAVNRGEMKGLAAPFIPLVNDQQSSGKMHWVCRVIYSRDCLAHDAR